MARRRTEPEKQHEAGREEFTPFEEVFTASARAEPAPDHRPDQDQDQDPFPFPDTDLVPDPQAEGEGPRTAEDPEGILAEPPDTRDISAELAAPPRARMPWLTLLLSGGVVAGLAFTGGVLVEKDHLQGAGGSGSAGRAFASEAAGQGRTGAAAPGGGGRRPGAGAGSAGQGAAGQNRPGDGTGAGQRGPRQGFGGGTGGPGGGAGLTTGTVKLVDGTTLYVTDAQGGVVKITTNTDTQITQARSGKVSDLQPGQTVTVRGTKDASGDVAATTVSEGGAGGFAGGFAGGGRG
ncbi:hypothetical protein AB0469_15415 [Streptomyces sp. NPDC093801]|uniref:hypothetical protein n=1 Tax=Streptomyces sp. NPDC093801 TaxID=3155203 RepID=UPI00344FDC63